MVDVPWNKTGPNQTKTVGKLSAHYNPDILV